MPDITIQVQNQAQQHKIRVALDEVVVGRDKDCTLTLGHPSMSRKHCRIFVENGSWYAEDLKSSGGTQLNGSEISGAALLKDKDTLALGAVELIIDQLDHSGDSSGGRRSIDTGIAAKLKKTGRQAVLPKTESNPAYNPGHETKSRKGVVKPRATSQIERQQHASTQEVLLGDLNYEADDFEQTDDFLQHESDIFD